LTQIEVVIPQHRAGDPSHIGHPFAKFTIPLIEEPVGRSYPSPETVGDPSRDPEIFVLDDSYQFVADLISPGRAHYLR